MVKSTKKSFADAAGDCSTSEAYHHVFRFPVGTEKDEERSNTVHHRGVDNYSIGSKCNVIRGEEIMTRVPPDKTSLPA